MTKNIIRVLTLFFVFFTFSSFQTITEQKKDKVLVNLIVMSLNTNHYTQVSIDNDLSVRAYELFLERMDNGKRFLLKSDVEKLSEYKYQIDNQVDKGSFDFFKLSYEMLIKRIDEAEQYYKDILSKPFDFNKDEQLETDSEKLDFVQTKKELKEQWRLSLKYQVLTRLVNKLEIQEKAEKENDTSVTIKSFRELEEAARKNVLKSHNDWYKRLGQLNESDYMSVYLNSIVNAVDPHTGYFPPKDKEDFDIRMSGRLEGIGATLQEKDGYIKVVRIVPGSASWQQGELKAGDLILKVAQGDEEAVDVVGMRLDEAVRLIRGKKGTKVVLTVKKIEGIITEIPIIRDVVILEEVYAKSAIIKDKETKKKIGFINLPQFYVDFTGTGGRRCAVDMKKEVEKLKKEKVDGIVIDLRDNGGGSLQDVVDIAGMFIEKGPIVQVKGRWSNPYVLTDRDPSLIYDGPLVVLVNELSASASEIFAAAMQDYDRAVIIGGNATFGKGTVQRFIELDKFINDPDLKPLGSLKITMQKFYRIDGRTTQLKGVIPDIIVPDEFNYIDIGERELDYPLQWNEIKAVDYTKWDPDYDLSEIVKNSSERIESDSVFMLLDENAHWVKERRDQTLVYLNLEKYRQHLKEVKARNKKYKNISKKIEDIEINNLKADLEYIQSDSSRMGRIEAWHKELNKDYYVFEAIHVLEDMIR